MSKPLAGQVVIVTGGARGIGLGIAKRLAAEGCRIALWDLSFQPFKASLAGFTPASIQTVDIADFDGVQRAYAATVADLGASRRDYGFIASAANDERVVTQTICRVRDRRYSTAPASTGPGIDHG